jgi:hypothetical protein
MDKKRNSELEIRRMQYAFWLAVIGLFLSATLVVFLIVWRDMPGTEVVSIVGVFTSVTGTLVGAFFGVQIGSMGREQEREEKEHMETMAMKALAALGPPKAEDIMREIKMLGKWVESDRPMDNIKYCHPVQL